MSATSAIYECEVSHHRLRPKVHQFRYRVFYLWLDLDELEGTAGRSWWLSRNRFNLFAFYDRDHLDFGKGSAKANLLHYLTGQGIEVSGIASIRLLTFPRILGYIFNPVCFYFALAADGAPVCAVAEVTNTFLEQKTYLITDRDEMDRLRLCIPKHFYVSPFAALDLRFDFKLRLPQEYLEIHIDDHDQEGPMLLTSLTGKRRTLTDGALLACAVKYPFLTLRVIWLIHWHAFRLWLKRVPWHRKSAHPEMQVEVLRPHHSLKVPPP